jgi:hypothetical protein
MSANAESQPIARNRLVRRLMVSIVVALAIAAFLWALSALSTPPTNDELVHRGPGLESAFGDTVSWDASKLEAMEGRQLAELRR